MSVITDLQRWYRAQCNDDWEHDRGITIESGDNPGWWVKIDLDGTVLAERAFERVAENLDDEGFAAGHRWLSCWVENGIWHGCGDETRLEEILTRFLNWARRGAEGPALQPRYPH